MFTGVLLGHISRFIKQKPHKYSKSHDGRLVWATLHALAKGSGHNMTLGRTTIALQYNHRVMHEIFEYSQSTRWQGEPCHDQHVNVELGRPEQKLD